MTDSVSKITAMYQTLAQTVGQHVKVCSSQLAVRKQLGQTIVIQGTQLTDIEARVNSLVSVDTSLPEWIEFYKVGKHFIRTSLID